MGSGCETAHETVDYLNEQGGKVGVLKVRLYRPFDVKRFMEALPASVKAIAVLDRTKEPGALGEPLYLDVVTALSEGLADGLGQAQGHAEGRRRPLRAVLEGIHPGDGQGRVRQPGRGQARRTTSPWASTTTSPTPAWPTIRSSRPSRTRSCARMFYGLGSDGTVGANKNSIKIIGENTDNYAQGYFVYDSKKAGAVTISHLRFGPEADPLDLPGEQGQLRRLPSAGLPGPLRHAQGAGARRHVPAQHAITARTRSGTSSRGRSRKT